MFISHKSNTIIVLAQVEWECRKQSKGISDDEYWAWLESVTTVTGTPPDATTTIDYSGETDYTIVECTDEDVTARLVELNDYINHNRGPDEALVYNIKWSDDKKDSEIVDVPAHKDEDGKDVAATYVQTHFIGDDSAKDARILAEQWTRIRKKRDKLLANSDWTQGGDSPLTSAKKTEWATYRTKLRDVPKDQKDKTTLASITWPSEPS